MVTFYTASVIYLGISVLLLIGMQAIGIRQRKLFASHFGSSRSPEELTEDETLERQRIHSKTIDSGFWRAVTVGYMFYHLPGFFVSVLIARGRPLNTITMFIASAVVWISILYLIFRPSVPE